MWEMQQLGRRVGALDVDLISNRPREDDVLFWSGDRCEKIWEMFEGRARYVDLISLLSAGEARATNSLLLV